MAVVPEKVTFFSVEEHEERTGDYKENVWNSGDAIASESSLPNGIKSITTSDQDKTIWCTKTATTERHGGRGN